MKEIVEKNFCLILEYVGTNYCGFQRQTNGLSIQEVVEKAIFETLNEKVDVVASGRTDAGVHALGQVANFHSTSTIPESKLKIVINQKLPKDIRVKKSFEVELSFNARKSAKKKTYLYKIYTGDDLSVFDENRVLHYTNKLNLKKLNKGAEILVGTHDFSSFVSSGNTSKDCIRTIYSSSFTKSGNYLYYEITGNGFLYNMVRIVVGTLLDVGTGKLSEVEFKNILEKRNRTFAGKTVSPDGLYLKDVRY